MTQEPRIRKVLSGTPTGLLNRIRGRRPVVIITGRRPERGVDVYEVDTADVSGTVLVTVREDEGTSTATVSIDSARKLKSDCVAEVGSALLGEITGRPFAPRRIVCLAEPDHDALITGLRTLGFEREGWTPGYPGDQNDRREIWAVLTNPSDSLVSSQRTSNVASG